MGLANLIGKAAKGAAPVALQAWRDKAEETKMATLQKYQQDNTQQQQAFTAGENKLSRDQSAAQFDTTTANQQTQFAATNANQQQQLAISKEQADSAVKKIDQELKIGKYSLDQAEQLKSVREEIIKATDDTTRAAAYEKYSMLLGKDKPDGFQSFTAYGDENDLGVQSKKSGVLNTSTGKVSFDAGGAAPAPKGTMPRPDAEKMLKANPSDPAMAQHFDEAYGKGEAQKVLGGAAPAATPAATKAPAPVALQGPQSSPAQTQSGAGTDLTQGEDPLAGYTLPGTSVTDQARQSSATAGKNNRQVVLNQAADDIVKILEGKDLRKLARVEGKIDDAIQSGKLNAAQIKVLNAYRNKTRNAE